MSPMPAAFAPAPMPEDKLSLLTRLTEGLEPHSLWWLSGYAAGLAERAPERAAERGAARPGIAAETLGAVKLSIVYGSQTGNSKRLAEQLAAQAESAGLATRLLRADAYPLNELKDERLLYLVISTQGDGDPPEDARGFVEYLAGKRAPELKRLKFAVLGLGDSSYPQFCGIARRLDLRFAQLGAQRLLDRGEADLDIESVATPWLQRALQTAKEQLKTSAPLASVTPLRPGPQAASPWSKEKPYAAELLLKQRISGRGSQKDVRHIELSLEGSGLSYQPGDALGVWAQNSPPLVAGVLAALHLDGEQLVSHGGVQLPLRDWLVGRRELSKLSRPFLLQHAERAQDSTLKSLLAPEQSAALGEFVAQRQLLDLLLQYPADWSAEALVAALRALTPRLYSLASSQLHVGPEAHLTVHHVHYQSVAGARWGVASHFLSAQDEGAQVPIFIEANARFRLPKDASRDLIMIGPGTGVAPFRGFVQERAAVGASGKNWLLFGNPHARHDFLYQLEWQQALKAGQLQRLDLAFSRDHAHKHYVQHLLEQNGRQVYAWLESGAHLYLCGDATRMARDVEAALLALIALHGAHDPDSARDYLSALQAQGRYARDVY